MRFPPASIWVAPYILLLAAPSTGTLTTNDSSSFLERRVLARRQVPYEDCTCDSCVSALRSPEEQGVSQATHKCQPAIVEESLCKSQLDPDCGPSDLLYTRFCIVYCRPILKGVQDQCIQIEDHELEFTKGGDDCLGQDPHSLTKVESDMMTRTALEAAAASKVTAGPPAGSQEALREIKRQRLEAQGAAEKAGQSLERIEKLAG